MKENEYEGVTHLKKKLGRGRHTGPFLIRTL